MIVVGMIKAPAERGASHVAHGMGRNSCGFSFLDPMSFRSGAKHFSPPCKPSMRSFLCVEDVGAREIAFLVRKALNPGRKCGVRGHGCDAVGSVRTTAGFTPDSENCRITRAAKSNGTSGKQSKLSVNRTVASSDKSQVQ
ncbi:hypothetical protein GOY17_04250 [Lysobacter soli]|uniref:hypothetical protein n=1 Tax=Lysobacter soli TaxID=453783 RepID=UPI0012EEADE5|nr:hypothetical protein [Lysobacter soli]QGW64196.1 hypothetical protein GOY17_04250 [Lysobacter soli]